MNQANGPHTDLTIYSKGLNADTEKSFEQLKCLYNIIAAIHSVMIILLFLISLVTLNIAFIVVMILNFLKLYYSVAYVHYPKSKSARSCFCSIVLLIFMFINLISFILIAVISFIMLISLIACPEFLEGIA